jgi:hypothetical protein
MRSRMTVCGVLAVLAAAALAAPAVATSTAGGSASTQPTKLAQAVK